MQELIKEFGKYLSSANKVLLHDGVLLPVEHQTRLQRYGFVSIVVGDEGYDFLKKHEKVLRLYNNPVEVKIVHLGSANADLGKEQDFIRVLAYGDDGELFEQHLNQPDSYLCPIKRKYYNPNANFVSVHTPVIYLAGSVDEYIDLHYDYYPTTDEMVEHVFETIKRTPMTREAVFIKKPDMTKLLSGVEVLSFDMYSHWHSDEKTEVLNTKEETRELLDKVSKAVSSTLTDVDLSELPEITEPFLRDRIEADQLYSKAYTARGVKRTSELEEMKKKDPSLKNLLRVMPLLLSSGNIDLELKLDETNYSVGVWGETVVICLGEFDFRLPLPGSTPFIPELTLQLVEKQHTGEFNIYKERLFAIEHGQDSTMETPSLELDSISKEEWTAAFEKRVDEITNSAIEKVNNEILEIAIEEANSRGMTFEEVVVKLEEIEKK